MTDQQRKIPLYLQIKRKLIDRIKSGDLTPGDAIPSESQLMQEYNVSRTTVRQAIRDLANDEIVETRRGAVARVKEAPKEELHNPGVVHHELGEDFSVKVLRSKFVDDHYFSKKKLELEDDAEVFTLERLRLANGYPIGIQQLFTPTYIGEILGDEGDKWFDIFPILGMHGVNYSTIKESVSATIANRYEADLLGITSGDPLIEISRVTLGVDYNPIEYSKTRYLPNAFDYRIEIGR
ncbi:GntR family transcriptional regulator [Alkalibacillus filiformis]|uniref:GntR family transcriptional regulator n=1 Tax=Alkalibacillus filiformis TaxID=200990 RepID=A0ABU0DUR3_9BACI|nr:GntR family transcriptional regulator [Alkalibacillus filiformis]MDQ0352199.1 GntR family transcriptional regulator [Alkalibacillus filiformis]